METSAQTGPFRQCSRAALALFAVVLRTTMLQGQSATAQAPPPSYRQVLTADGGVVAGAPPQLVVPAADGSIWVSSRMSSPPFPHFVRVFDTAGRLVRTLEGFHAVSRMEADGELIVIRDHVDQRVSAYSTAGERVRTYLLRRDSIIARAIGLRGGYTLVVAAPTRPVTLSDSARVFDVILLRHPGTPRTDTLARIRSDLAWNAANKGWNSPSFGRSGAVAWLGDSVVAIVDGHAGTVRRYRFGASGMTQEPAVRIGRLRPVTPEDVAAAELLIRSTAVGPPGRVFPVRLTHTAAQWSVADRALVAVDGTVWVRVYSPRPHPQTWIVIPPNGAPTVRTLPDRFMLEGVRGTRLYGRYDGTGGAVVRVYEIEQ